MITMSGGAGDPIVDSAKDRLGNPSTRTRSRSATRPAGRHRGRRHEARNGRTGCVSVTSASARPGVARVGMVTGYVLPSPCRSRLQPPHRSPPRGSDVCEAAVPASTTARGRTWPRLGHLSLGARLPAEKDGQMRAVGMSGGVLRAPGELQAARRRARAIRLARLHIESTSSSIIC